MENNVPDTTNHPFYILYHGDQRNVEKVFLWYILLKPSSWFLRSNYTDLTEECLIYTHFNAQQCHYPL